MAALAALAAAQPVGGCTAAPGTPLRRARRPPAMHAGSVGTRTRCRRPGFAHIAGRLRCVLRSVVLPGGARCCRLLPHAHSRALPPSQAAAGGAAGSNEGSAGGGGQRWQGRAACSTDPVSLIQRVCGLNTRRHGTARNVSSRTQSQHCERQQRRAARRRQRLPRNAPPAAAAGDAEQRLEACRQSAEEGRQQNANELKPAATEKTECCQLGGGGPARGPGCTLAAAPPSLPRLHPTTQHPNPPPSPAPRRAPSRQSVLACEVSQ